jgi:hypothetical protein
MGAVVAADFTAAAAAMVVADTANQRFSEQFFKAEIKRSQPSFFSIPTPFTFTATPDLFTLSFDTNTRRSDVEDRGARLSFQPS